MTEGKKLAQVDICGHCGAKKGSQIIFSDHCCISSEEIFFSVLFILGSTYVNTISIKCR